MEAAEPGANGLIAYPYLNGSLQPHNELRNVRAPSSSARGWTRKRQHFLRAIFEGVAFLLRENIELIEEVNHIEIKEIRSLGGGSKSAVWRADQGGRHASPHRRARGVGMRVPRRRHPRGGRAGVLPETRKTAAEQANRVVDWKQPDASLAACYDALYQKYCALYPRLNSACMNQRQPSIIRRNTG